MNLLVPISSHTVSNSLAYVVSDNVEYTVISENRLSSAKQKLWTRSVCSVLVHLVHYVVIFNLNIALKSTFNRIMYVFHLHLIVFAFRSLFCFLVSPSWPMDLLAFCLHCRGHHREVDVSRPQLSLPLCYLRARPGF